jgi:Uma2 family endonuclease
MQHARSIEKRQMSEAEFFDWIGTQEGRFELVEGCVMMQAGATRAHERVAKRIFRALYDQVDEAIFDVNKGDFGVRIRAGTGKGTVLYPDVVVDLQSGSGSERATTTPVVIVEVLSESTDYDHHERKLEQYKKRETLAQYVVFEQGQPRAYAWTKTDGGWSTEPDLIAGIDAVVRFPRIAATVAMADVYRTAEPPPDRPP